MKKALSVGIIILLAIGASFVVYASNVSNSRHNMLLPEQMTSTGTQEVCVFCHTPHQSTTTAALWNRADSAVSNYTVYGDPFGSMVGDGADMQPSGVSRACLSCHDGTVAIDSVNNPSPDNYVPGMNTIVGGWLTGGFGGAILNGSGLIGTSLADDHPISMNYLSGPAPTADPDLQPIDSGESTVTGYWTLKTVPLFANGGNYTVECGSCHNVHDNEFEPFLRFSNDNSFLCLTCHNK